MTAAMPDSADSDKIEIFLSDDQKIKSVGELLTNGSSRIILQLLFEGELTAGEISQKSDISLQLVKYHLNKMQQVGMVRMSRVGKNTKSHDMKYYKATKFAIVILPSKVSDRAKESKSLIRSFKTIYKFAGVGVAAAAGLLSVSFLQQQPSVPSGAEYPDAAYQMAPSTSPTEPHTEAESSAVYLDSAGSQVAGQSALEEALVLQDRDTDAADASPASGSGTPYVDVGDLLVGAVIAAVVLGAAFAYFFFRARRYSAMQKR